MFKRYIVEVHIDQRKLCDSPMYFVDFESAQSSADRHARHFPGVCFVVFDKKLRKTVHKAKVCTDQKASEYF